MKWWGIAGIVTAMVASGVFWIIVIIGRDPDHYEAHKKMMRGKKIS